MEDRWPLINHMRLMLRTWIVPSGPRNDLIWSLYADSDRTKFIIRRFADSSVWLGNLGQWENLEIIPWRKHPFREAESDSPELGEALKALGQETLLVSTEGKPGHLTDPGYGIRLMAGSTTIETAWWGAPPAGWEGFTDRVLELQQLLDACFEKPALYESMPDWPYGQKIRTWIAFNAASIKGLMGPLFMTLVEKNLLLDIPSIYRLKDHREELIALHALGETGADQLLQEIEDSKYRPLDQIINGFNTGAFGNTRALAKAFRTLEAFAVATPSQLEAIPELTPAQLKYVIEWLGSQANQQLVKDLIALGLRPSASRA